MITIEAWVREEQAMLWDDLMNDIRRSVSGSWSIASEHRACRIIEAARIVGPTPPESITWGLVASGIYAAVLTAGGIDAPEIPWGEEMWQRMTEYGTREELADRYAGTLQAIAEDAAYIQAETGVDGEGDA